ncbi:chaplin family protein [Streptomyces sp. NPDC006704]|uniref:chaplin family protein n=1 Tax=Streptomyces sp. NPDC006704 TaxID=3364760 RepID=UPI0036761C1F
MKTHKTWALLGIAVTAVGSGLASAAPASAGGIGDFLSPAFGTSCGNLNNGALAAGNTHHSTGTAGGNLARLPLSGPLNQCGGADLPAPRNVCVPIPVIGAALCQATG